MLILGLLGAKALYLLFAWLIGAAMGAYLSERKGYGQRPGLTTGLILSLLGGIIWIFIPAREGSDWKIKGVFGNTRKDADAAA